jgi:ATP-dependent Clp protease protease subunit
MDDFMLDCGNIVDVSPIIDDVFKKNLEKRILILNQYINEDLIEKYVISIWQWNLEDVKIPPANRKPILLIINTVGGDVYPGLALTDIMLQSETPIYTLGMGLVASMGYTIYLAGKKRYSFQNTTYLQHDGAITLANSAGKAKDAMMHFEQLAERDRNYILSRTTMPTEIYEKNKEREFYMDSEIAKSYGVVHEIIGLDITLKDLLSYFV